MDLSVFNLLMSTNPNAAAENLFPGAVQNSAPVDSVDSSIKTGEAFLQALDQVRTGKTEKNADILYNTLSARADAASSLKDLKKGNAVPENVKIVKLHIKRTRASQTLRKLDEEKATPASAAPQSGKKIPTRENIAAAQEVTPIPQEQIDLQDVSSAVVPQTFSSSDFFIEQPETPFVSTDEITAADILINSAIQATLMPSPQTPQITVTEQAPEAHSLSAAFLPQKETVSDPVRSQTVLPDQKPEIQTETQTEPQKTPVFAAVETPVQKQDKFTFAPDRENIASVSNKRPEEHAKTAEIKQPEEIQNVLSVKPNDHKAVKAAETQTKATPETAAVPRSASVDTVNVEEIQSVDKDYSSHQAHRQAEQLAHELPAQTNIAITVQTQTPVVQELTLPHNVSPRSSSVRKAKETDTEPKELTIEKKEDQISPVSAKELTLHSGKTEHLRPSAQETTQENQPNVLAAALPVQNKVLSDSSPLQQADGQTVEINTPSVSTTPTAAFSVGHELKGKAVSGSVPVQKNIPVNELADQIKVNIKKALKDGLDKIDIVLKPKELGTIKIHLEIGKDGSMKAILSTARAETLDLLQSDLSALKQALADSGFDLNDQSFSFNYRGERYNDEHRQPHSQNRFIAEESVDETAETAGTLSISGRYALNIRV